MFVKWTLIISVLSVFISCTSFPAPESEKDTMLVILVEQDKNDRNDWIGYHYLKITDKSNRLAKTIKIPTTRSYAYVTGLLPGEYYISSVLLKDAEDGTVVAEDNENIHFSLKALTISFLQKKFVNRQWADPKKENSTWIEYKLVNYEKKDREELLKILEENDNFILWKK